MLTETDDSIEQICYECGFNTLSNFNKKFKEIISKKPTEYKKEFMTIKHRFGDQLLFKIKFILYELN